ncbi:MAG: NTP transferase domain-containing protein [Lentisphaerae bacterium]|nr:NTP transferase domain-containing protein [Lentisphaerota bacterium]MBT5607024.1 NTP transferase domain-containing protein [Lentisphaerota bacterium]MBT7055778.1 NTP transferase domain-containing protein [Lentisphaerota bacterium]
MGINDDTVCVVLAGGRGKRMASGDCHKVCFPISGTPAIVRAIDTYKQAGLRRFLVVIGQMADQVVATVSKAHPEVTFVCQAEPRGTGHAALVAVEALAAQNYAGNVMIVMGDKVTDPQVVRRLFQRYGKTRPDALLTTLPLSPQTTAGRVVEGKDGAVLGIVELADIRRARETGGQLYVNGRAFTGDQIEENSKVVNVSMYMFRFTVLHEALRRLSPSNAQGELYLTDTAEYIAKTGSVDLMRLDDPTDLMAFNTPAELLAIEEVIQRRAGVPLVAVDVDTVLDERTFKPAQQWLEDLEAFGPSLRARFADTYGGDSSVLEDRRRAMLGLIQAFIGQFGPSRKAIICRAPGRINLMGRHVDHRGGYVNVMAINREVLVAASPRDDDVVRLRNLNVTQFPNHEFRIFDMLSAEDWPDWLDFLETRTVQEVLEKAPGDWSHYIRAPMLRLQHERTDTRLKGMDCMVSGNIPMGAGLSSSSALVVAFAQATIALNGLDVTMHDFVDLCGEGEWFVGSRGGSADHAAIRAGKLGHVLRIGFFPFQLAGEVELPTDLRLIVAHSGASAKKSESARDVYNQRVACYEFAQMLLRRRWPAAAGIEHLRDLEPDKLQVNASDVYRALTFLPENPSRLELREMLSGSDRERAEQLFATHADIGPYDLRGVTLYGISECIRSRTFADVVATGKMEDIKRMMGVSHDGDRVVRFDDDGTCRPDVTSTDDDTLCRLAASSPALGEQTGRYACSTEAVDHLVDIANGCEGVVGAQLTGAGMGGCMMILAWANALEHVQDRLKNLFYVPREIPSDIHVCNPVAGAGLFRSAR